jgi:hypothetical protein
MSPTRLGVVTCASLLSLALTACGDSKPASEMDAGPDVTTDAGTPADAGNTPDDAGTEPTDAGTPDAGPSCISVPAGEGGEARWQGLGSGVNGGNIYSRTDATADSSGNVLSIQHRLRPRPSNDDTDILLTKRSPEGQVLWQKAYGSTREDGARDLRADGTGHVFLAGTFGYKGASITATYASIDLGTGPLETVATNEDGFVAKVAPDGTTVWATPVTCSEESGVGELALLPSGNVLVAGGAKFQCPVKVGPDSFPAQGPSTNRSYVAELDGATGQLVWGMGVPGPRNSPTFVPRLATGPGGEVFIATLGETSPQVFALTADAARTQRWNRALPGLWDVRIAAHPDGGLYLVGLFEGTVDVGTGPLTAPAGDAAFVAARLDAEGNTVAARVLGPADDIYGEVDDVEVDGAGRLLVVGEGLVGPIDSGHGPFAVRGEFAALVDRDLTVTWARQFACSSPNGAGRRGEGVLVSGSLVLSSSVDLGAGPIPGDGTSQFFAVQYGP